MGHFMRHPLNYCPNFNVFKLNCYLQTIFLIVPLTLDIIRLHQLRVLCCDDDEKQKVVADFLSSATIIEKAPIPGWVHVLAAEAFYKHGLVHPHGHGKLELKFIKLYMEMYKDLYTNILETLFSLLPVSWMARLPPSADSLAPLTLPGYPTTESPPWTGSSAQVLQVKACT